MQKRENDQGTGLEGEYIGLGSREFSAGREHSCCQLETETWRKNDDMSENFPETLNRSPGDIDVSRRIKCYQDEDIVKGGKCKEANRHRWEGNGRASEADETRKLAVKRRLFEDHGIAELLDFWVSASKRDIAEMDTRRTPRAEPRVERSQYGQRARRAETGKQKTQVKVENKGGIGDQLM
ncbi:hypothetical protein K438DRAFT_1764157 [Mycena galopus ATCC 62051]|nr:hypothetical protein K438DRAFT_1764157 [Mycena galopus ATCC 62051]